MYKKVQFGTGILMRMSEREGECKFLIMSN